MKRDAIDLSTLNVFTLFRKYFVPTLLGMLSMSAVTDRKSTRLNSSHMPKSRMPSSA